MNGNTIKILAVGIVIVVAAAGAGAFFLLNKDKKDSTDIDAALEVYGNADNNYKIDDSDIDVIQNIIDKKEGYTLEKYPLADAYKDGVVDDKDIDQVKKIIAGGDEGKSFKVWYINHSTNTTAYPNGTYVADMTWPVQKCIANGAANALIIYEMVGIRDNISGINYSATSPPDPKVYSYYNAMPSLGTSTNYLTENLLTDCVAANPGTTAVITADNKGYLDGSSGVSEQYIEEELHLDVVRIKHAAVDPNEYSSAILMIGFMFQKETKAQEAAEWVTEVFKDITEKTSTVDKKVRVLASSYQTYVSARNSDYADVTIKAGGEYTLGTENVSSVYFSGSKKDASLFTPEKQPDVIICIRTGSGFLKASWYDDSSKWDVNNMKTQLQNYSEFNCYGEKKVYTISGDMPIVARVLYAAVILYPDLFTMEKADELHQEFVDKFLNSSYKVSDLKFVLSQSEVENLA